MSTQKQRKPIHTGQRQEQFDPRSGGWLERLIFNHRLMIVLACLAATALLGLQAMHLQVNASFERMIPQSHPFIRNYLENRAELRGLGNSVRIAVENTNGDIYDPAYLEVLRKVNDTVFLMQGVDRAFMRSLWTPLVRWTEVTEEGFSGGPVLADSYDGSRKSLDDLRANVARARIAGSIVSNDQRSSMVVVPLLERDPDTDRPLDYAALSAQLESRVRALETGTVRIHIIGFAKLMGDLMDGLRQVALFFLIATVIAVAIIFAYTRCIRSTALVTACSLAAVVWQLGLVHLLGFALDPYSVLVPFLVFAIGVSHGAQKMNGVMGDVGRGAHRYAAARFTFRRLFIAGLTALLADVVGIAVLAVIDIPVIHDLALTASIGIALLACTNLVLLPVLLSYVGVSPAAAARSVRAEQGGAGKLDFLAHFTGRNWARAAVAVALLLAGAGYAVSLHVKIGDLNSGAPELRVDSRYNRDNAFITSRFGLSSDMFAFIVTSPDRGAGKFPALIDEDRFEQELRGLPGVQTTVSAASLVRSTTPGFFEGNLKWATINRDDAVLSDALNQIQMSHPEVINGDRTVGTVIAYLADHKAETLQRMVDVGTRFAAEHGADGTRFMLAAGSAGIDATTNIVVRDANRQMLLMVYAAVILLCFITFRSWRAVVVAVIPLALTSILCEALMVFLGIGIKVATLPVIALGVGIGVDYALYLLSVQLAHQRAGESLREAYGKALRFTGKVVALVGITLAAGVITWIYSPIKFQADMGILLTFMFLVNMVGALTLIPALSYFLLRDVGKDKHSHVKVAPTV